MTTYDDGFEQTLQWIKQGTTGPQPLPPEGLHRISLTEWQNGAAAAFNFKKEMDAIEEDLADRFVDTVLHAMYCLGIVLGVWLIFHGPWPWSGIGFALLIGAAYKFRKLDKEIKAREDAKRDKKD